MKFPNAALVLAAIACVTPAPAGPAPRPAGALPAAGARPSSGLPDSVLARAAGRDITLADFRGAWEQLRPPQRPDSLTPKAAREFLDLLAGKELLGVRATREHWTWTSEESLRHEALHDRLTMGIALDSALAETRRGMKEGANDRGAVGEAARDAYFSRQEGRWDDALLERVAAAFRSVPEPSRDSSLMAQIRMLGVPPPVAPEDLPRALVTGKDGAFTVNDLLEAWSRLNPLSRPRVTAPAQVQDLVKNGLFERALRREAGRRALDQWPQVARAIELDREFIAVEHYVGREVYDRIPMDSVTIARFFDREAAYWKLPLRVRLLELVLPSRSAASAMMVKLADPAEADSLAARAGRSQVSYWAEVSAESDSVLFERARRGGTGAVLGPDSTRGGWRVARVAEILPPRYRALPEVRKLVEKRWYDLEAERRIVELLERLRREGPVAINRRALAALSSR